MTGWRVGESDWRSSISRPYQESEHAPQSATRCWASLSGASCVLLWIHHAERLGCRQRHYVQGGRLQGNRNDKLRHRPFLGKIGLPRHTGGNVHARLRQISGAVNMPVNGDLEAGYGDSPEAVAETIGMAIGAGLAGGNIEDKKLPEGTLYEEDLAVERIAAERRTINANNSAFVLTARTDAFRMSWQDALKIVIRRANRFREAEADCLFATGIVGLETIKTLVSEINGPLNILIGPGTTTGNAHTIQEAGVQGISLGGSIARSAFGFVRQCACELRDSGTLTFTAGQLSPADLNTLFAGRQKGGVT